MCGLGKIQVQLTEAQHSSIVPKVSQRDLVIGKSANGCLSMAFDVFWLPLRLIILGLARS